MRQPYDSLFIDHLSLYQPERLVDEAFFNAWRREVNSLLGSFAINHHPKMRTGLRHGELITMVGGHGRPYSTRKSGLCDEIFISQHHHCQEDVVVGYKIRNLKEREYGNGRSGFNYKILDEMRGSIFDSWDTLSEANVFNETRIAAETRKRTGSDSRSRIEAAATNRAQLEEQPEGLEEEWVKQISRCKRTLERLKYTSILKASSRPLAATSSLKSLMVSSFGSKGQVTWPTKKTPWSTR